MADPIKLYVVSGNIAGQNFKELTHIKNESDCLTYRPATITDIVQKVAASYYIKIANKEKTPLELEGELWNVKIEKGEDEFPFEGQKITLTCQDGRQETWETY